MSNLTTDEKLSALFDEGGPLISKELYATFTDAYMCVGFIISLTGTVLNGLNIRAFLLIGKQDGVTVSLLTLSLSDFGFCSSGLVLMLSHFFSRLEDLFDIIFSINPWVFTVYTYNIGNIFYSMTGLTTTYLAFARCMCVVKPLIFSDTFTRSRSIVVHIFCAIICTISVLLIFAQSGVERSYDAKVNQTRIIAWFSDKREDFKDTVNLIFHVVLTFISQFTLIVCASIMANYLREIGKFRQSAKTAGVGLSEDATQESKEYKLSGKELQVINQVVLISVICIVCSLPKIYTALYSLVEPEYDVGKRYNNSYLLANRCRRIFDLVNSTSTFFIYFNYNSRFRELYVGSKHI